MRIIAIGDIHGRTIYKDIIEQEKDFDKIIFLGDYVTSHEGISADTQLSNLEDILTLKEKFSDRVILLRGNHCLDCLGYYWAECYPTEPKVKQVMSVDPLKNRFLSLTQWIYIDNEIKTIFSHAGVSQVWMDANNIKSIEDINKLEPSEIFGFTPDSMFDCYGNSVTQPPTWIRPTSLYRCNVKGYTQVVGHTPVKKIVDIYKSTVNNEHIWLCDNLANKEYLVIEDGMFIPKVLI